MGDKMNFLKSIKTNYFTPVENGGSRVNNFNVIRFVAAIMVIYGHMSAIMGVTVFSLYGQAVSTVAVKILMIISGFLITKSYLSDQNYFRFMIKRCFRIFPALIAITVLTVICGAFATCLTFKEYVADPYTRMYFRNIILYPIYNLPGVFGDFPLNGTVNGSLWTLPVEFAMYLILPLIISAFNKLKCLKSGIFFTALITLAVDIIRIVVNPNSRVVFYGTNWADAISIIPFFFIGCLWSFPEINKYLNLQLGAFAFFCGTLISLSYAKSELLLALVLPYFVLSFSLSEKPFFGNWFSKCDFSYGMYLYGFPVQQVLYHFISKRFEPSLNLMTLVCVIVAFFCAVLSWYIIEKPAQNLGKKILKKIKS